MTGAEPTATATEELACLDGRTTPAAEATIPVTDEGLLRGYGAFEVVRVYGGRTFALSDHLDRLERSAAGLRLAEGVPRAELEREASALLVERDREGFDGCLRICLTRDGRRLLLTEPVPGGPERPRLGYVTYAPPRVLDGIKSLSYAANMLASRLARERGFDEALLVTPHGRVLEAPTASLFWVDRRGTLSTPPLDDHILPSITRDRVMQLVDVEERHATPEQLEEASESFLASTTREVLAVAAIEDHELEANGERTRAAAAALADYIGESLD